MRRPGRQLVAVQSRPNVRRFGPAASPSPAPPANAGAPSPDAAKPTKKQSKATRSKGFSFGSAIVFNPSADGKKGGQVVRVTLRPSLPWPVFLAKPLKLEIDTSFPTIGQQYSFDAKLKAPFKLFKLGPMSLSPYFFVGAGLNQFGYANLNVGGAAKFKVNLLNALGGQTHLSLFTDGGTKLQYDFEKHKAKMKQFVTFGITIGGFF